MERLPRMSRFQEKQSRISADSVFRHAFRVVDPVYEVISSNKSGRHHSMMS